MRADTRERIYVQWSGDSSVVWMSGITFREFVAAWRPTGLLLLKHRYPGAHWHRETGLEYITEDEVEAFCRDDLYSYGDLFLADIPNVEALDRMSDQEVAEVLFLGHTKRPLDTPFIPGLGNRFFYLTHDDG